MLIERTLADFAERAASKEPVPGGGSVSAYIGALGAALGAMAGRFTEGRKGFEDHAPTLAAEVARLDELRQRLEDLVDVDAQAYTGLSAAFKLPRGSEDEKQARREAIQTGLQAAMEPPLEMCRACVGGLELLDTLRQHVNPNLASDVAVGAYALAAAFRGASVNVLVNRAGIKDPAIRERVSKEGAALAEQATALEARIIKDVIASLES